MTTSKSVWSASVWPARGLNVATFGRALEAAEFAAVRTADNSAPKIFSRACSGIPNISLVRRLSVAHSGLLCAGLRRSRPIHRPADQSTGNAARSAEVGALDGQFAGIDRAAIG